MILFKYIMIKHINDFYFENVEDIKNFFIINNHLYTPHSLIGGMGGLSTFKNHGKLFYEFDILDGFCKSLADLTKYYLIDMWSNLGPPGTYVKPHNHYSESFPNSISGVFYLQKPKNSGNFVMEDKEILVETGDLILFESTAMHWTKKNQSNENRIVISFNLCPEPYKFEPSVF